MKAEIVPFPCFPPPLPVCLLACLCIDGPARGSSRTLHLVVLAPQPPPRRQAVRTRVSRRVALWPCRFVVDRSAYHRQSPGRSASFLFYIFSSAYRTVPSGPVTPKLLRSQRLQLPCALRVLRMCCALWSTTPLHTLFLPQHYQLIRRLMQCRAVGNTKETEYRIRTRHWYFLTVDPQCSSQAGQGSERR